MPLPSGKKRDPWPSRRRDEASAAEFTPRRALDDGESDYELVSCPGCKTRNVVHGEADLAETPCVYCQSPLNISQGRTRTSRLAGLFERFTGIRKRTRQRLGYRRALAAFELEIDPNLHLEGERLRQAMQEWLEEHHTPWDRQHPLKKNFWGDHPAVRIGLIAVGAAALVSCILLVHKIRTERAQASNTSPILPPIDAVGELQEAAPKEFERARPVAEYFLAADSVERLLSVVRDRKRVEPLVRSFYASEAPVPIAHREITLIDAANFGGRIFLRLAAELPDGQFAGITLERTERKYLVDWESFVGHSDVDWAAFKADAPNLSQTVRLRAYASFIEQYHPPFDDSKTYQSIWLQSQEGEYLVGYMPRLDKACIDLREKMGGAGKNRYEVIVSVRYPEEDWSREEVEIVELVQTGWVEWDRLPALLTVPQL